MLEEYNVTLSVRIKKLGSNSQNSPVLRRPIKELESPRSLCNTVLLNQRGCTTGQLKIQFPLK